MKKITRTTIKSFLKREIKNNNLYTKTLSNFDGMTDSVTHLQSSDFHKADPQDFDLDKKYNFGLAGLWLVGSSRDYFTPYADDTYIGYTISNACGSSIVAMKRPYA